MKNRKYFIEKHKQIGMDMKILNVILVSNQTEIYQNSKTIKEGERLSFHEKKANDALGIVRDHLEEIMFRDYPKEATTNIYYGDRPDEFKENSKGEPK